MAFQQLDQYDYHRILDDTSGISLVLFLKHGCSSCNAWLDLLIEYQTLHPAINLFSADVGQDPGLAQELELFHLPSIMMYTNGDFHCELQSVARLPDLEAAIQKALSLPSAESP